MICNKCKGTGKIKIKDERASVMTNSYYEFPCPECKGTGQKDRINK